MPKLKGDPVRMCRMCLTTSCKLRMLFTIFRNHNLVFIVRDYARLEINEQDKLPKMICKSCAVKLIRLREIISLFTESDRKLREKLDSGNDLPEVLDELKQNRKRPYNRRRRTSDDTDEDDDEDEADGADSVEDDKNRVDSQREKFSDGKTEATKIESDMDIGFEFNEIKQESDSEEDNLPLQILQRSSKTPLDVSILEDGCKQEENVPSSNIDEPSSMCITKLEQSDQESDNRLDINGASSDDSHLKKKEPSVGKKLKNLVVKARPKRIQRKRKLRIKPKDDSEDNDDDGDDEDIDKTFNPGNATEESEEDSLLVELKHDSDKEAPSKRKRGRKKGSIIGKPSKRKKKSSKPNEPEDSSKTLPTLHDFKCYICNSESLGSHKAMIEHLTTNHMDRIPHTCTLCVMETIVLTRVRTLNTHLKMHAQPVKCDYCDRRYSNAAGKYYHTQTFHLGGGAPCQVTCEVCDKVCNSEQSLKTHMRYHTRRLKCSQCDMVFNHSNKLRYHERIHRENSGHECIICKKVLRSIESYDVHLKKHNQERSYGCHLCSKKFNTSSNLILHLRVHAKNEGYRPAKSWIEHYTVLNRNPMHFKCNHCDRYETDKVNNMISHLQAHFKEYECDHCHHKFATAKQLRAHVTTHTGEKPEKCSYCDKVFATKNNLRIHLRATHPEWVPQRSKSSAKVSTVAMPTVSVRRSPGTGSPVSDMFSNSGNPRAVGTGFAFMNLPQQPTMASGQQQSALVPQTNAHQQLAQELNVLRG
ncbi:zinc finger protein 37-like [Uranotaenia lowii]|uniref:zinc finger protein 37-like n=1 Tax=Uranotaenia lowii TaxID=190385 RepID=UPI002479DA49|nr:zinc finger protein 37-like [Uranotaenia lowii]